MIHAHTQGNKQTYQEIVKNKKGYAWLSSITKQIYTGSWNKDRPQWRNTETLPGYEGMLMEKLKLRQNFTRALFVEAILCAQRIWLEAIAWIYSKLCLIITFHDEMTRSVEKEKVVTFP